MLHETFFTGAKGNFRHKEQRWCLSSSRSSYSLYLPAAVYLKAMIISWHRLPTHLSRNFSLSYTGVTVTRWPASPMQLPCHSVSREQSYPLDTGREEKVNCLVSQQVETKICFEYFLGILLIMLGHVGGRGEDLGYWIWLIFKTVTNLIASVRLACKQSIWMIKWFILPIHLQKILLKKAMGSLTPIFPFPINLLSVIFEVCYECKHNVALSGLRKSSSQFICWDMCCKSMICLLC